MRSAALILLLSTELAQSVFLRWKLPEKPEARVKHLVQDIAESVSKAGEDAEMVFSTLLAYDAQLGSSLKRESRTLTQTLTSLQALQKTYKADISAAVSKLASLGSIAQDSEKMASKYETGTSATQRKFDSLQQNVAMLIALLKDAKVTRQGILVTAEAPDAHNEPARVYTAIRRLLRANPGLRDLHPDVFAAFIPRSVSQLPIVHMTQGLLQHTMAALAGVGERWESLESQALLQSNTLHRRFEGDALSAGASAEAEQGVEAENEQKAAELEFSVKFTSEVLKIDEAFNETVDAHKKSNEDLIHTIRDLRQSQLKSLKDLSSIFRADGSIAAGLSFLEARSVRSPSHAGFLGGVENEVETAIHNNGDTHAILMRMDEMLDETEPISTSNVQNTMSEMEGVLQSVQADGSKYEDAKRRCESEKFHAKEQEEGLTANLDLMSAAYDHANKAIKAAATNLQGIEKKKQALKKSFHEFSRINAEAFKSLDAQSNDRKAILMAVRKATEVVAPVGPSLKEIYSATSAGTDAFLGVHRRMAIMQLMDSLYGDIEEQQVKEIAYHKNQELFQHQFSDYVQEYTSLLQERRRHYEASQGILQLHVTELATDLQSQRETVSTAQQISGQSVDLCRSVLSFYRKHTNLRADLSAALKSVIPAIASSA